MEVVNVMSQARFGRRRLAGIPDDLKPVDTAGAYELQAAVTGHWAGQLGGFAGYKIACTSEIPQRQLGISEPYYGRLFNGTVFDSPVELDTSGFFMRVVESEFGFQIARDLPDGGGYTQGDMAGAVAGVVPAIEIVDSRYDDWEKVGAHSLIIDNAVHGAWIKGRLSAEFGDLGEHAVRLIANGEVVTSGKGSAALGHPLKALAWLANALPRYGLTLKKGDWVTTGVVTDLYYAKAGDHLVADFGSLGEVAVSFR